MVSEAGKHLFPLQVAGTSENSNSIKKIPAKQVPAGIRNPQYFFETCSPSFNGIVKDFLPAAPLQLKLETGRGLHAGIKLQGVIHGFYCFSIHSGQDVPTSQSDLGDERILRNTTDHQPIGLPLVEIRNDPHLFSSAG